MRTLSVEQQINNLRPSVTSGLALYFHNWLLASAIVLVIVSIYFRHPVPLMIAAFLGIVGLCERRAGPNIVVAIKAYDMNASSFGEVSITISCWDMNNDYHALIREQNEPDWEYEFIPQGWQPTTGTYAARIWRVDSGGPPVLTAVEAGILIPRYAPKHPGA
ncbi:MAG: hypothetical protein HXX11_13605 [Desulfuromonadales bacterium]|nr:hypothetical protein [Desulfuromonadales bacterium]